MCSSVTYASIESSCDQAPSIHFQYKFALASSARPGSSRRVFRARSTSA
jgi:hypothetical protein